MSSIQMYGQCQSYQSSRFHDSLLVFECLCVGYGEHGDFPHLLFVYSNYNPIPKRLVCGRGYCIAGARLVRSGISMATKCANTNKLLIILIAP